MSTEKKPEVLTVEVPVAFLEQVHGLLINHATFNLVAKAYLPIIAGLTELINKKE